MHSFRLGFAFAAATLLATAAAAYAVVAEIGPLYVGASVEVHPRELPGNGYAPVTVTTTVRVGERDHSPIPTLQRLELFFDRNGLIHAAQFPTCSLKRLTDATTPEARARCRGALVGRGTVKIEVHLPGDSRRVEALKLSLFNAPAVGGQPALIAHVFEQLPVPKALVVPISIEPIHRGRYGYRTNIELPQLAGGYGAPIETEASIGATRLIAGRRLGFVSARCRGGRLQAYGQVTFTDGDYFPTTLTSPCHTPR